MQNIDLAVETYRLLSERWFTHASPTLFNAGTPRPQLSSCFLICMKNDSIEGIYDTLKECAVISKSAGGIGLSIHNIRAVGSYIRGTNGNSNGIVPMLRVFNDTARCDGFCCLAPFHSVLSSLVGSILLMLSPWLRSFFRSADCAVGCCFRDTSRRNSFKEVQTVQAVYLACMKSWALVQEVVG